MVKQGFDPSIVSDPLYFRDDAVKSFVPLNRELFEKIKQGQVRV